jgi:ribonuclease P protein component
MRRGEDFDRAVRSGIRVGRDTVVMHVVWGRPSPSLHPQSGDEAVDDSAERTAQPARLGIIVSRAVGPSVVRSTVKRRLRHVLRDRVGHFPEDSLVVVRATPKAAAASSSRLAEDVDRVIDRVTDKARSGTQVARTTARVRGAR